MSKRLSVIHVVLSLDCGGLEHVVLHLLREGQALGQRVSVLCLERAGTLAPQAEALGAEVHCADKKPGLRLGTTRRVRSLLAGITPDVVHTHQVGALFYSGPAARAAGVPLVVHTEHGKHYAARRRTRWLGWLAGRHVARFFCVSEDIAREVVTCRVAPESRVRVVPNGIDTARFRQANGLAVRQSLGIPEAAPVVGTVGRVTEIKRQDLLVRAFARVRAQTPGAHLLVVGDGPCLADLKALAAGLSLAGAVHFTGYQPEPQRFLSTLDVFALTSRSEGMPLVVLEAWAAGVPVVASAVGGLPQLVSHGENGLLVPYADEEALVVALTGLLGDATARRRLASEALAEVTARYDVRHMTSQYEDHYRELLGTRAGGLPCAS
jgi:glycosyltransferase involved in cell wall biosynthesis